MSLPATEPGAPRTHHPRHEFFQVLRWALACALGAGAMWAIGVTASLSFLNVRTYQTEWITTHGPIATLVLMVGGAFSGLIVGVLVGLIQYSRHFGQAVLLSFLAGTIGGGLCIPTILVCTPWIHPLVSSSLMWAGVGLLVGISGYRTAHQKNGQRKALTQTRFTHALRWATTCALGPGSIWAFALVVLQFIFGVPFLPSKSADNTEVLTILYATLGMGYGLVVGAAIGVFRGKEIASSLILGFGGMLFGSLGGGLSMFVLPMIAVWVHPIVGSSLVWAGIGFCAGLCGYFLSPAEDDSLELPDEKESTEHATEYKVEWLLRERKRQERKRAVFRVLPVIAVSVSSLVVAGIFASKDLATGLLAVGLLGLSVAYVLYNQEKRLLTLEQRSPKKPTITG